MSRGVLDSRVARSVALRARSFARHMKSLGHRGRWIHWQTLACKVRFERPDLHVWLQAWSMRAAAAFILSYVLVLTVGMIVAPDGTRSPRPNPSAGPAPVTHTRDVLPARPSLVDPRRDGPSKHTLGSETFLDNHPTALDGQSPRLEGRQRSAEPAAAPRHGGSAEGRAAVPTGDTSLPSVSIAPRPGLAAARSGVTGAVHSVTGITLWGTPSRPWVSITATGPVRYQLRNVEPAWVVVDLSRAQLALAAGTPPASRGLIKLIRAGQFAPETVRVVVELTETVSFHVATSPDKTAVIVSLAGLSRAGELIERRHLTVPRQPSVTARLTGPSRPARETP